MRALVALIALLILIGVAYAGAKVDSLHMVFGILIPYLAVVTFVVGFIIRIVQWAKVPAPFRIPTTAGQQKSLPWIKSDFLDNPHNMLGVLGRMALEVLVFRSLVRNTSTEIRKGADGEKVIYNSNLWLWGFALAFHWGFLIILIRHMRFFTAPVPFFIQWTEYLDGILQIGVPAFYITDGLILAGLTFLFARRLYSSQLRYISLPGDYFPLFLLLSIVLTGVGMRYWPHARVDVEAVKVLAIGLVSFSPSIPESPIGPYFYVHLFLVCSLIIYFPFSKLMHAGGVFFSPTRNMANSNRAIHHPLPWALETHPHKYADYEEHFHDKMAKCGLPMDKEYADEGEEG